MKKNVRLILLFALMAVMLVMTAVCVSAADVATETEFKAAVANGGEINLTADFTLSGAITVDKSVTINGNGNTITMGANNLTANAGTLTLNNVNLTHSTGYAVTAHGELILQNCVITGSDASNGIHAYGSLSVIDSEITTGTGGWVIRASGGSNATLSVTGSRLIGNTSGGAIVVGATYTTTITVTDTYMTGYRGIRFYNYSGSAANVTMTGVTYRPMQATGKVIAWEGTNVPTSTDKTYTFINCDLNTTVRHNGTANTSSAAMFAEVSGQKNTWVFENCTLAHNGSTNMFYFMKGSTVKLKNCTATHSGSSYMFAASESVTWNVTGGTYTHSGSSYLLRVSDTNCTFHLTDATFVKNGSNNMIVLNNGKLNIKGSTLTHSTTSAMIYFGSSQSGPLYIEDSTLTSGTANSLSLQGTHPVTLINTTVDKINIPAGYAASVSLTDVTVGTLVDPDGVAVITSTKAKNFEINGTAYTFEEIMSVIKDGDVVKIIGNVGALDLNTTVAFTIDFNGYDVPAPVFYEGNRLTFLNYKVSVSSGKALTVPSGVTLTLGEGCALTSTGSGFVIENSGTLTINGGSYGGTIHANAGSVTINGGTFRQTGTFVHGNAGTPILWMNNLEATIIVNDGDFKKTATDHAKCCIIGTNDANAAMIIKGGRFEVEGEGGYAVANFQSNDGLEITGGTFISANTENPVIRIAYMYGTRYASDAKASSLKDFTTVGGSVGILFEVHEKWTFTVENVTVTNAAKGLFHVDNYDADPKIVFKGRYTFASDATDAAMLTVANGRVILDGVTFINSSENSEASIVMTDKTPTVTFKNAMVLAKSGAVCKTTANTVYFGVTKTKLSGTDYKLWMATEGESDASLDIGASVRAELDTEGIRFTGTATKVEGATYGILIAPADYIAAAGAFTKEALDAFAAEKGLSASAVYQMVVAAKSLQDHGDTVSFSVALVNIKSTNADRAFAAVPFVTVNGETTYGDYDSAYNARSMAKIAAKALTDTKTAAELAADPSLAAKYCHVVTEGVFGKYTAAQRDALKLYVGEGGFAGENEPENEEKKEEHILHRKKVIFLGNSYVFWGKTVLNTSYKTQEKRNYDQGMFYQLCQRMGAEVDVTNWCFSGHSIREIFADSCNDCSIDHKTYLKDRYYDYVVISPGESNFDKTIVTVMEFFKEANPDVKFIILGNQTAYGYSTMGSELDYIREMYAGLEDQGVLIADWGGLMDGIITDKYAVPNATQTYDRYTFFVPESSIRHGTLLTGYLESMFVYCAITGESATTLPYDFCTDASVREEFDADKFIESYFTNGETTNFVEVFNSAADMNGIQQLVDWYLANKPYRTQEN